MCKIIIQRSEYAICVYGSEDRSHTRPEEQPRDVGRGSPSVSSVGKITRCEALQRCAVRGNFCSH